MKQSCWVFCPACRNELTAPDDDSAFTDTGGLVTYVCSKCGTKSKWDFCAPVPLLLDASPLAHEQTALTSNDPNVIIDATWPKASTA